MHRDFDRHYPDRPYGASDRRRGGHGGRGFDMHSLLDGKPDAQILFVGALACTRHRNDQLSEKWRSTYGGENRRIPTIFSGDLIEHRQGRNWI